MQRADTGQLSAPGESDEQPQQVEPGLWRIPLPLPFALRSANVYLIDNGDATWTLLDAGFGLPADEAALHAGLAAAGVSLADVTALILTHAHPDHIGLSRPIHEASAAPVYLFAGEETAMYRVWSTPDDPAGDPLDAVAAMYAANGMTADEAAGSTSIIKRLRRILRVAPRSAIRPLQDGDDLQLGAHTYKVIWTPGHSDHHMCLLREDGHFFSGDHVLPGITPNIGWYPNARPDPLGDYFDALRKVRDLPARLVLPGHRLPFTDLATRVDELYNHHRERGDQILALLAAHPDGATATAVATLLFGHRLRDADDRRFAVVEMLAHLEHLRLTGRATRTTHDSVVVYRAAADARSIDSALAS